MIEQELTQEQKDIEISLIVMRCLPLHIVFGREVRKSESYGCGLPFDASSYEKEMYERQHSNDILQQVKIEAMNKREQPCPI